MASRTSVDDYLNEIGRYPLLTPEQEIALGRKVQRMMELRQLKEERPLTPTEKKQYEAGKRAADKFVRSNLKLVVTVAKKYIRSVRHMDILDLIQEGNIGLLRGVEKFDPARGYKFSTYAYWWIRQGMSRAIAVKERTVKLPSTVHDIAANWNKMTRELTASLGRFPNIHEIADYFNCSIEEIQTFINRGMHQPVSLDRVMNNDEGSVMMELISDPSDPDGEAALEKALYSEYSEILEIAYQFLDEKERYVLDARWGLNGKEPRSFVDIGRELGVSRERVRQLLQRIHRKIQYRVIHNAQFSREAFDREFKEKVSFSRVA